MTTKTVPYSRAPTTGRATMPDESSCDWSADDIIGSLQACAEDVGESPSLQRYADWRDETHPSRATAKRHFGTWNGAKRAAGLDIPTHRWSEDDIITSLQACADDLGESPTIRQYSEWRDGDHPSWETAERHFGSWNDAKRAAGLDTRGYITTGLRYDETVRAAVNARLAELTRGGES